MTIRRFPPPWTVVEENAACFILKDHAGLSLAYVYFEEEPGRRAATRLMTRDEARQLQPTSPICRSCWASRKRRTFHSVPASTYTRKGSKTVLTVPYSVQASNPATGRHHPRRQWR